MFHEFPKMLYSHGKEPVVVHSQKEHDALVGDWQETPVPSAPNRGDKLPIPKTFPKWMYRGDMGIVVENAEDLVGLDGVWLDEPLEPSEAILQRADTTTDFGADEVKGADPVEGVRNRQRGSKPKTPTLKTSGDGLDAGDWTKSGDGTDYPA